MDLNGRQQSILQIPSLRDPWNDGFEQSMCMEELTVDNEEELEIVDHKVG